MARYGIPEDDIAIVVGIDAKTLRKHFRLELDVAFVKANAKVAESIFLQAVGAPAQYYPAGHPDAGKLMRAEQTARARCRHLVGTHPRRTLRVRPAAAEAAGQEGGGATCGRERGAGYRLG